MVEWIEPPGTVGEPVTEQNALDVLRAEVPCYSRKVQDCVEMKASVLSEKGVFDDECRRIREAADKAPTDEYNVWVNEIPYCPDFFRYPRKAESRGSDTLKAAGAGLIIGAVVGAALF